VAVGFSVAQWSWTVGLRALRTGIQVLSELLGAGHFSRCLNEHLLYAKPYCGH